MKAVFAENCICMSRNWFYNAKDEKPLLFVKLNNASAVRLHTANPQKQLGLHHQSRR